MTPKELLYVKDALGHEQHMQQKCQQKRQGQQCIDGNVRNHEPAGTKKSGTGGQPLMDPVQQITVDQNINRYNQK